MEPAQKQCPFCLETIWAAAIVCRFCGRDLDGSSLPTSAPPALTRRSIPADNASLHLIGIGLLLLIVTLLLWPHVACWLPM